jgi:hypothetical protein
MLLKCIRIFNAGSKDIFHILSRRNLFISISFSGVKGYVKGVEVFPGQYILKV